VISLCIPSRDEELLAQTVASGFAAGADEVVIVDDGSKVPVKAFSDSRVKISRLRVSRGPSYARNLAGKLSTGDIVIYSDAHVLFPPDGLKVIAELAHEKDTVVQACTKAMNGTRDWIGYGGLAVDIGPGIDIQYNRDKDHQPTGYIGSVYGATRKCWESIDWWIHTASWAYNEQALTLSVLYSGRMPVVAPVVCEHLFKKAFNYPVNTRQTRVNRLMVHYQCCENFFSYWLPIFRKNFRAATEAFNFWLAENRQEAEGWRKARLLRSVRGDDDVMKIIVAHSEAPSFAASRQADSPASPTVCSFTPFAKNREAVLGHWLRGLRSAGARIEIGRAHV
jgi:glycosyltransferase involved in cell wall biosynthesis